MEEQMKKYMVLLIGILFLVVSFIWMVLLGESTGPFWVLSAIGGAIMVEGIHRLRKRR